MKKLLKGLLALVFACTLVGCNGNGGKETTIDMSSFPENFEDWTAQDVVDYMIAKDVFTVEDYAYVQVRNDEINPCPDSLTEMGSYMDNEGLITSIIYYWDVEESELINTEYENAKANKEVNLVYTQWNESMTYPVAHMIGQIGFFDASADLEHAEKFEQAIQDLASDVGVELTY